ncbi:MAG: DUF1778 domain-containing protein [Aliidongia sp.]
MMDQTTTAEVNIHLRARAQDRAIIDQAAELVGANRSQFMMASALKEAKNILLDQSTIHADAKTCKRGKRPGGLMFGRSVGLWCDVSTQGNG